jgi:hypothetical protein
MVIDTVKYDSTKLQKHSFVRLHLIREIFNRIENKLNSANMPKDSFIYFEDPIKTTIYSIDRFGKGSFYFHDQILPIHWSSITGTILLETYNRLKKNEVYFYSKLGGKFYKTKTKK